MPGFVALTNRATGADEQVPTEQVTAALATGKYLDPGALAVHRDGLDTYAPSDVAVREQSFSPTIDPALSATAAAHTIREREHSGIAAGARAAVGGVVSGVSAGLVSPFEEDQEFNQGAAMGGQLIGAIAPALVGDEAGLAGLLPSSVIGRAGAGVAERLGGGLVGRAVGGVAEGALYGAGQGVGELARSDDPLTYEHAASVLSSNMLYGGGIGGVAGVAGHSLERGLLKAKGAIDERLARPTFDAPVVAPEIAALDDTGVRSAYDAEHAALTDARHAERRQFVDDLAAHRADEIAGAEAPASSPGIPDYSSLKKLDADYLENTVPARSIADRGYYEPPGGHTDPVRNANAARAISEGQREPITLVMSPSGKIQVEGGRHRLAAAVAADAPIDVKWGYGSEPTEDMVRRGIGRAATPEDIRQVEAGLSINRDRISELNAKIDKALADPEGLAKNPGAISRHLEHQENDYKSLIRSLEDDGRDSSQAAAALERNRAMQDRIRALNEPVGSPKLAELRRARQVDPSTLDRAGLKQAEAFETAAIHAEQQPQREAFVQSLKDSFRRTEEDRVWHFTQGHEDPAMKGLGKEALKANISIRSALGNEASLARDPGKVLDALERQAQALDKIKSLGNAEYAKYSRDFDMGPATIRKEMAEGKIEGYKIGKGGLKPDSPLIEKGVKEEMIKRFGSADNAVLPPRLKAWDKSFAAADRNRELQAAIKKLKVEPTSPYLDAIKNAREEMNLPKDEHSSHFGAHLLHSIPVVGGPLAAVASISGKVTGGFRKFVGKAAERTGQAASSFLDTATKAARIAPPVATKILLSLRYAAGAENGKTLPELYKARTDEVKGQTAYDANGIPRIRPEARQAIAGQLKAIAATDPILADRLETLAVRRIEYLSSLIPRRPDFGVMQVGPDHWHPSDLEMRSWARSAAAAEDPQGVFERAVMGTITPEDVNAVRAVAPEMLDDFTGRIVAGQSTLKKPLPYGRKLALSMLTGQPVDPAMHPMVLSVLQGQFASDGVPQTQAPMAAPQFGSIKKSTPQPTPAERRAQGGNA